MPATDPGTQRRATTPHAIVRTANLHIHGARGATILPSGWPLLLASPSKLAGRLIRQAPAIEAIGDPGNPSVWSSRIVPATVTTPSAKVVSAIRRSPPKQKIALA